MDIDLLVIGMMSLPIHTGAMQRITEEERTGPEEPGTTPQYQSQSKSQSKSEREPLKSIE